jgi:Mrp family chromosome partitioning ATPase
VNGFARSLVAVARQYVGPAAPAFVDREIRAIGLSPDTITVEQAGAVGERVRATASEIMDAARADAFARALALADVTDEDSLDETRSADLGTRILAVSRQHLGPAAPAFIARELAMLGTSIDEVTSRQLTALVERARSSAGVLMDVSRAEAFAAALAGAADPHETQMRVPSAIGKEHSAGPRDRSHIVERASSGMASVLPAGLLEAARLLRANLKPGDVNTAPPPLMVLGTTSDPGCARVAAGLAAVLAEEGKQTLLVDADIRNPSLHEIFGMLVSPGLAEALDADVSVVLPTPVDRAMSFLPAGRSVRSAGELLRLPRAADIAAGLAARFGAVVYAGSGDPSYPDAMFLAARVVRAAVLVIRLGRDSAEDVRRVKAPLEEAGVAILGFALLDNRNSLWVPKLSWTPWGRNGIDATPTLTPARWTARG